MKKIEIAAILCIFAGLFMFGCAPDEKFNSIDYRSSDSNHFHNTRSTGTAQESPKLPELNENSGISDYLDYAALNNPGLEAAFNRWKAAVEQIPQAQSLPDPQIKYSNYVRQSDMQMEQMISVMQMFPWFGKIEAGTEAAYANAEAARKRFEESKLKLYWQVKREFYEFLYLREAIETARQNLELVKYFEQIARTKYATSTAAHPDVIRAQIEYAKLDEILVSIRELKKPQIARLNAVLNRPAEADLDWPVRPEFSTPDMDYAQLLEQLKETNPRLSELGWMIESAKSELKLARKKFYPDVGIGVEWTQFEKSGAMSGRDSVAVMFQMNLPIWTENYKAAERQANAELRSVKLQKKDVENTIAAEIAGALYDLEESQRKIILYKNILSMAQQLVNTSETAYRAGAVDFLSLIDSQRMLLQYNLDYHRALTDNQQKLAELEMLIGQKIRMKENKTDWP